MCDNLDDNEKEQFWKKGKKVMHGNLGDGKKEQLGKNDKERRINVYIHLTKKAVFLTVSKCAVWLIPVHWQQQLSD